MDSWNMHYATRWRDTTEMRRRCPTLKIRRNEDALSYGEVYVSALSIRRLYRILICFKAAQNVKSRCSIDEVIISSLTTQQFSCGNIGQSNRISKHSRA
jgi:hypothetical protein